MSDNRATTENLMKRIKQGIKTLMKWIEQGIEAVEKWFISPVKQFFKAFKEWFTTNLLSILIILLFVLVAILVDVIIDDKSGWIDLLDREGKVDAFYLIGIAMGGVLLAIQATVSYRRVKTMEDTAKAQADAAQAQADAAKAQADASKAQAEAVEQQAKANKNTEQGQRQERFKNAIDHLGHEGSSVRLGGAYELFHLAEDTEELRQTVLEILCAHIRRTTRNEAYQKEYGEKPSEEIQSLLTLLFVQDHKAFRDYHINLYGSYLNGAFLPTARLQGTDLRKAHLQGAALWEAQLQGALLWDAHLQKADLSDAQLQGAVLLSAQLQGADLRQAQLQGAELPDAQLQGADLSDVQLQGANLLGAQLQGVFSSDDNESQWYSFSDFAERIQRRIDRKSDFSTVVFSGGLNEEQVDNMTRVMLDSELAGQLEEILKPHIGKPISHELPSDAETGSYTEEDAERWIKEYEEAVNRDDVHS